MTYDITEISTLLVKLAFLCLTVFVIPYFKNKLGNEKFNDALGWVRIAVSAAEQLYNSNQGNEKKQYVLDYIASKGLNLDANTLDKMIESCVLELHNQLYGTSK